MLKKQLVAVAALLAFGATAQASIIKVESASAALTSESSAAQYQAAVDAALAGVSYVSTNVSSYNFTHASLFGGNSNFALKTTTSFGVSSADAGLWQFRTGADFDGGGAMFIDGLAVDFKSNNMWWAGSYNVASQFFAATLNLAAGNHTISVYGFEGCCDGSIQQQYKKAGSDFKTFSSLDGLAPSVVPEPATFAIALTGLVMLGLSRRRKSNVSKQATVALAA
jgi:hypothetical protein